MSTREQHPLLRLVGGLQDVRQRGLCPHTFCLVFTRAKFPSQGWRQNGLRHLVTSPKSLYDAVTSSPAWQGPSLSLLQIQGLTPLSVHRRNLAFQ